MAKAQKKPPVGITKKPKKAGKQFYFKSGGSLIGENRYPIPDKGSIPFPRSIFIMKDKILKTLEVIEKLIYHGRYFSPNRDKIVIEKSLIRILEIYKDK